MGRRIKYGTLAASLLIGVFAADMAAALHWDQFGPLGALIRHGSVIPLVAAIVMLAGAGELVNLMRSTGTHPNAPLALATTAALMLMPWLSAGGVFGDNPSDTDALRWQAVAFGALTLGTAVWQIRLGRPAEAIRDIAATWFVPLYVGFLPSFMIHLRCHPHLPGADGAWILFVVIATTKFADIGAYFVGARLGRQRLAPVISAGKSVEGLWGGIALATFASVALSRWSSLTTPSDLYSPMLTIPQAIVFGVLVSLSGQIGDLFESCLKRSAATKDSAQVIPELGGLLDVIDSPVFAAPVAWFLLTICWEVL